MFSAFNEDLFKEITQLLTLENFRWGNYAEFKYLFNFINEFTWVLVIYYVNFFPHKYAEIMSSYQNMGILSLQGV